jgi:hypothetical protein
MGLWDNQQFTIMDAYAPRPPIQYAVDGLFAIPSLNIVYGAPGCLKSMLLADMAICIASGNQWLEPMPNDPIKSKPFQTKLAGVMWLDFDNGVNRTHNRFEALARHYQVPDDTGTLIYYSMPNPILDAGKTNRIMDFIDLLVAYPVRVIIIDNLATISGGRDENSSEMMQVMSNMKLVSERTCTTIILIHHSRKDNGYKGKMGDNLRGFSGIRGSIDRGLYVEREPNSLQIKISSEKTRDTEIKPFGAYFTFTHKSGCNDLDTARFFGVSVDEDNPKAEIENEIVSVLKNKSGTRINQTQLVNAVQGNLKSNGSHHGINKIRNIIAELVRRGIVQYAENFITKSKEYWI